MVLFQKKGERVMFRLLIWVLVVLNTVLISSFSFLQQPINNIVHIGPEWQLAAYLLWLSFNSLMFLVLIAKADMVGEGAITFASLSFTGTVALVLITLLCIFVANARPNDLFIIWFQIILGVTTFGQFVTNLYCFDKRVTS